MGYVLTDILQEVIPLIERQGITLRAAFLDPERLRVDRGKASVDVEVEVDLRNALMSRYPNMGFRAEEEPEHNRPPAPDCDLTWLLDPHDGTSAAGRGFRGASVSLALIRDGVPVLGIVYAYAGPTSGQDLISWAEGQASVHRNGQPVNQQAREFPLALVSKYADRSAEPYVSTLAPIRYLASPGIAYRLARVAAGDADVAISLSVPRDFDCAGGHALLMGAGMDLYDEAGRAIRYHDESQAQYHYCFGGTQSLCATLAGLDWTACLSSKQSATPIDGIFEPRADRLEGDDGVLSRAQGAWLGLLVGDALGAQVEGMPSDEIQAHWPQGVNALLDGGRHGLLAGQTTDDSEMASALASTLLHREDYNADAAAQAYGTWLNSSPFSLGRTTLTALSAIGEASTPAQAARSAAKRDSQANGALMRALPIAIAGVYRSEGWTISAATEDAMLTHPHAVCVAANRVYCALVRYGIKEQCSGEALYQYALRFVDRDSSSSPVAEVVRAAEHAAPADYLTHMGWVRIALHNALFELRTAKGLNEGLQRTIARGGDTDTNACIAGGLLGAVYGISGMPTHWLESILTCRPHKADPAACRPRPPLYWSGDALIVAEQLLKAGARQT